MLGPDGTVKVPALPPSRCSKGCVTVDGAPEPYNDAKAVDHLVRLRKADIDRCPLRSPGPRPGAHHHHIDCRRRLAGDQVVISIHLTKAGVDYDVIGQSYYPHWHGSLEMSVTISRDTRRTART